VKRTHGATAGGKKTPEYDVWNMMRQRCDNPRCKGYADYGARGIKVCRRWEKFENFIADMGRRPVGKYGIDRIRNSRGYSPSNCRWATYKEQSRNTRRNLWVEAFGRKQTLAAWCEELGLVYFKTRKRILRGWEPERALRP
jgi:hypothetical protein